MKQILVIILLLVTGPQRFNETYYVLEPPKMSNGEMEEGWVFLSVIPRVEELKRLENKRKKK